VEDPSEELYRAAKAAEVEWLDELERAAKRPNQKWKTRKKNLEDYKEAKDILLKKRGRPKSK